jgi:heptosyltransferase-2
MQKVLVIQTAFIGDAVLATALLEKFHHVHPHAKLDLLVRKGNESLFTGHPFLNQLLIWDKNKNKYRNLFKLLKQIRGYQYDLVINVQRFAATGWLTAFSGAGTKVGFDKNPFSLFFDRRIEHVVKESQEILHEIDRNQRLIAPWTDDLPARPRLYPSASDFLVVEQFTGKPYITIAPSSVWFTKQFPAEKWIEFLDRLPHRFKVYLIGASSDLPLGESIRQSTTHPAVTNLCGQLNFLQSAALQQKAIMNYVNDSAPLHFASAVDAPVTAVYCSTIPSFGFGPLSTQSHIVQLSKPLSCRPCGLHGRSACPQQHFECAMGINTGDLLEVLPAAD